ncbi:MAG TPA: FecR domain-containing protein, partial [Acidobacteriota bacterium]|nr:FecR domain-containing protein [Acidobacteriota bacterium]
MKTDSESRRAIAALTAVRRVLVLLGLCLAVSCASNTAFRNAETALANKNWDVAVAEYSRAIAQDPNNGEIKLKLGMAKVFAARAHYAEAKRMEDAGKLQEAAMELEVAVDLDPDNKTAGEELDRLKNAIAHPQMMEVEQEPAEHPLSELPSVALQPEFSPKKDVPIELKFKDTSLKEVVTTLGKIGDVNILFDNDFKDIPVSFDFTNTTFLHALDSVLSSSHNFYKVIGRNTLMIAPDRPEKRAEYEETVSRTFYLSSAEVEEVARTLRNVLGIQMIATDVRLNSVTIKDRITRVL